MLIADYKNANESERERGKQPIVKRVYKIVRIASVVLLSAHNVQKARNMTAIHRQELDPHSGKLYDILASALKGLTLQGEVVMYLRVNYQPLNPELNQHLQRGRSIICLV